MEADSMHSPPVDIAEMEKLVRSISQDGLVWGACELHSPSM